MKQLLNLLLFSVITLSITSCKRQYAFVQPAQLDNFVLKNKRTENKKLQIVEVTKKEEIKNEIETKFPVLETITVEEQELQPEVISDLQLIEKNRISKNVVPYEGTFVDKTDLQHLVKHDYEKDETKKKAFKRLNSMIPTGFILLGVAILLALVNLNSLALLFGLASILFLYLGFKRFYRKRNRRQIFK